MQMTAYMIRYFTRPFCSPVALKTMLAALGYLRSMTNDATLNAGYASSIDFHHVNLNA